MYPLWHSQVYSRLLEGTAVHIPLEPQGFPLHRAKIVFWWCTVEYHKLLRARSNWALSYLIALALPKWIEYQFSIMSTNEFNKHKWYSGTNISVTNFCYKDLSVIFWKTNTMSTSASNTCTSVIVPIDWCWGIRADISASTWVWLTWIWKYVENICYPVLLYSHIFSLLKFEEKNAHERQFCKVWILFENYTLTFVWPVLNVIGRAICFGIGSCSLPVRSLESLYFAAEFVPVSCCRILLKTHINGCRSCHTGEQNNKQVSKNTATLNLLSKKYKKFSPCDHWIPISCFHIVSS